jgi:hypothetical protein
MSQIEVDKIIPQSGTSTQLGESGDTITIPAGATITNNGTANGFGSADTEKVKVSANDTTAGFLNGKLVAGTNISLTEGNDGGNETLTAALSGTIATAQIADDAVTLAKMAPGTDGNIISYDASGNPVAVATGSAGQILTSAGAGAPPTFETLASEANTPAFQVLLSSSQSVNSGTNTVIAFDTEIFDSDNAVSSGVFTVPSGKAGKYFFAVNGGMNTGNNIEYVNLWISKNNQTTIATTSGWAIAIEYYHQGDAGSSNQIQSVSGTMDLAVGDSVKIYILHNFGSSKGTADKGRFTFSGHRLIT